MHSTSLPSFIQRVEATNELSDDAFAVQYLPISSQLLTYTPKSSDSSSSLTSYTLNLQSITSVAKADLKACFDLVEQTSADDYRASTKGWKPRAKWREMAEPHMRYILVRATSTNGTHSDSATRPILAFTSFMITVEDARPVAYVYEIHLSNAVRRQGIGAHLMHVIEEVALKTGMEVVMLTVFRHNENARKFYASMAFGVDESSPRDRLLRGGKVKRCDYLILSKLMGDRSSPAGEEEWEDEDG